MDRMECFPTALAEARLVADALVIGADPYAARTSPYYWHRAQPLAELVTGLAVGAADGPTAEAARAVLSEPTDPDRHRELSRALAAHRTARPGAEASLVDAARRMDRDSRMGHHLATVDETLRALASPSVPQSPGVPGAAGGAEPEHVQIVVPFRDDEGLDGAGHRGENLLTCLRALRDQHPVPGGYTVTVVEADARPRWREAIRELADEYLFAPHEGPFNKAWAVNAGVVNSSSGAGLVCVLDGDILVDRGFVARNAGRFSTIPGTGGFLPYRDVIYLDPGSSQAAAGARLSYDDGGGHDGKALLRGFVLRRPLGACVWARRDVFARVNGMDERYEGWGREDVDFVLRLQAATAFDQFHDTLAHLYHLSTAQIVNGESRNAHLPWMSWQPEGPIGRLRS